MSVESPKSDFGFFGFSVRHRGFTLVEVLVVVSIILILIALLVPNIEKVRIRAEGIVCTSKLNNLWHTFSGSLHDGNAWPQVPQGIKIGSLQEQQWWLDYSSNTMGLRTKDWQCSTIVRSSMSTNPSEKSCLISYLPTLFDAKKGTPFKWPSMPWFMEIGNAHGNGNLIIRTDGAVLSSGSSSNL